MIKKLLFLLFPVVIFAQNFDDLKKADAFFSQSKNDSAIFYFKKGFTNCTNCETIEMANYYLQYAEAQKIAEKGEIALKYIVKAEKIFIKFSNYNGLVNTKITKAELYRFLNKTKKGNAAIQEAKKLINKYAISKKIQARYYDRKIALTKKTQKTAPELIKLCKKGLALANEINDYKLQFSLLNELGYTYTFSKSEKLKATAFYKKALQIARKYHLKYEICDVLFTLGIHTKKESAALEKAGKKIKSIQKFKEYESYHKEALKIATELKYKIKQRDISYYLYLSYRDFKRYKEAMKYCKIAYQYEIDRLENSKEKEVAKIEGKYLSEKRNILLKQKKSEIKRQYIGLFFLIVVLLILSYFLVKSKKDKKNIQHQKNKIEEGLLQKTILLKEVHHRVKNNLQVISSLLYLQAQKHNKREIDTMVQSSQKHINSIALVHEMLYQDNELSLVGMQKYIEKLGSKIFQMFSEKNVFLEVKANSISLPIDYAIPLGLVLNELLTNSLKYAFLHKQGMINICLEETFKNHYQFTYKDNGVGMDIENTHFSSLGIKLVKMLVEEMDGKIKMINKKGLTYIITFTINKQKNG